MKDMKLIMEGWREYSSVDEQYDQALAYLLESYDGLLTEGVKDDLLSGMKSLVAQFGKKAVTMALVASITTGALAPGIAAAAETATGVDLPVAAQQMDAEEAKKFSKARSAIKMAHKSMQMATSITQEKIDTANKMIADLETMIENGEAPSEGRVKKLNDLF